VDGLKVGACPEASTKLPVGVHSVSVGEALGNDRYMAYELERVEVQNDSTQNIIADLVLTTSEKAARLAYALGGKEIEIDRLNRPEGSTAGALSPEGNILAIGAETNSVRLYNAIDGKFLRRLGAPGEYWVSFVTALCFSADGNLLATNGWLYDKYIGEINIWETRTGKLLRTISNVPRVSTLNFSPDGNLLAAGLRNSTIKMWNVINGGSFRPIRLPGRDEYDVSPLLFSRDGKELIVGQSGGQSIYVYDAFEGKLKYTWPGNLAVVGRDGLVFTFSYKGYDKTLQDTWRLSTGTLVESKLLPKPALRALNEQIVTAAIGREAVDPRNEPLMRALNEAGSIVPTPNGRWLSFYHAGGVIEFLPVVPEAADDAGTAEIHTIDFCEMVKNPQFYFDKTVRLVATYEMATEGQYLRDDRCQLTHDQQIGAGLEVRDEKQSEILNTELRKISSNEFGGRAIVTLVGKLRNASRHDFVWYEYRFEIIKVEKITPVMVPYERELQAGISYRATVRGDEDFGLSLIPPPRVREYHSMRIEWINLGDFPGLEKLGAHERRIVFTVLVDELKQMTQFRWNRNVKCKIIRLE